MDYRQQLHIPEEFVSVNALPEDPAGCSVFAFQNSNTLGFVKVFPVERAQAMRLGDSSRIIEGIHESLAENQALIQVSEERCPEDGLPCVYSIVKTMQQPPDQPGTSVQYFLRMNLFTDEGVLEVQAFFDEVGVTGMRDATAFELLLREGLVKFDDGKATGWWRDPYEPDLDRPYLMNLSEEPRFDRLFPDHPLSVCRQLVATMTGTDPAAPLPALYLRKPAERPSGKTVFASWFERWTFWGCERDAGNGFVLYTDGRLYRVEYSRYVQGKPVRYQLLVTDKDLAKRVREYIDVDWEGIGALPDKTEGCCTDGHCYFLKLRTKTISGYMMYYSPEFGKRLAALRDGVLELINSVYDTSER